MSSAGYHVISPVHATECSNRNVGSAFVLGPESMTYVRPRPGNSIVRPGGTRPTGATRGSPGSLGAGSLNNGRNAGSRGVGSLNKEQSRFKVIKVASFRHAPSSLGAC